MLVFLFSKGYKVVPFILVFDFFSFYTKIQTICKLKTGKEEPQFLIRCTHDSKKTANNMLSAKVKIILN